MDSRVSKPIFEQYAIFQTGGKQYQAIPGKTISVEKLVGEAGTELSFSEVLFRKEADGKFEFGKPYVTGATIQASIIKQMRNPKIIIFKFKRRKKYRLKQGHRQQQTIIRIVSI